MPVPKKPVPVRFPGRLIRAFLLAALAVVATGWALFRYYTRVKQPMVVPVEAGEIPAPEIVPAD
jgi:hypothetical protein